MSRRTLRIWSFVAGTALSLLGAGVMWVYFDRLSRWQFFLVVLAFLVLMSLGEVYGSRSLGEAHGSRKGRNVVGKEGMIGRQGRVAKTCDPIGKVKILGEWWNAESIDGSEIEEGQEVVVRDIEGLT